MPRKARTKSNSGIYHIIMRGINRQTIFEDEEDYKKFIHTIQRFKEICEYKIYAYCLMGNHFHILLKEGTEPLETIMRRICGCYVFWYNRKYERIGSLFQDRYKSEPIEENEYLFNVIRYIFRNPIKAGIVNNVQNYKWTNYLDYIQGFNHTEIDFVLNIINTDREKAISGFIEYVNRNDDDKCLDIQDKRSITDDNARIIIRTQCNVDHAIDIQKFTVDKRNIYLKDLKERCGLSIRQIERLTGISRGVIQRI